ncbi:hypothetical protein H6P81_007436 [Aristolochia fimbriata]|uniref:Cytochrome P450 n=1 Tax=Aristolochia fimbriata TaxID=158543 RepID=A0AAV7F411_ARIFI|nr:hypothetical protein H6P81_007436 [Aristolochia fimbriata]
MSYICPFQYYSLELSLDLVMAGMDTTTSTIEWAMSEMMQNKDIMKKDQEELDQKRSGFIRQLISCCRGLQATSAPPEDTRSHRGVGSWSTCGVCIGRDPDAWDQPRCSSININMKGTDNIIKKWDFSGNDFQLLPIRDRDRGGSVPVLPWPIGCSLTHSIASLLHSFDWSLPEKTTTVNLTGKFGPGGLKEGTAARYCTCI